MVLCIGDCNYNNSGNVHGGINGMEGGGGGVVVIVAILIKSNVD